MEEKTLTALQGSIKKWEEIVSGTGSDDGSQNCPLCLLFVDKCADTDDWRVDGCCGCPVAERVETSGCSRTPYSKWASYTWDHLGDTTEVETGWRKVFDERSKELAQAEVDFLRSLLPLAPQSDGT